MSITTFAELKTAIGTWLARTENDAILADFITLTEAEFNYGSEAIQPLRTIEMQKRATTTTSSANLTNSRYLPLPSDFLEAVRIHIDGSLDTKLGYLEPGKMTSLYDDGSTGLPKHYTFTDGMLELGPPPDATYTVEMLYYRTIPALTASNTTNWLLTSHPNVYLYGALEKAQLYVRNPEMTTVIQRRYAGATAGLVNSDERTKHSGSTLRVRAG